MINGFHYFPMRSVLFFLRRCFNRPPLQFGVDAFFAAKVNLQVFNFFLPPIAALQQPGLNKLGDSFTRFFANEFDFRRMPSLIYLLSNK